MASAQRKQDNNSIQQCGATLRKEALLALFAVLLFLPGSATADAISGDAIEEVEQGAWISVHDQRWRLIDSARTASMPWSVLAPAESSSVYVAHVGVGKRNKDNVWRYQRDSLERAARSTFDGHGVELAMHGGQLFVSNSRENELLALHPESLSVERRYRTGPVPKDFVIHGSDAYIALWRGGSIEKIDLQDGTKTRLKTGARTRGVAISPDGSLGAATSFAADTVSLFDPKTMKALGRVKACGSPRHAVFSSDSNSLWVSCHSSDEVVEIDPRQQRVLRKIGVAAGPKTLALSGDDLVIVAAEDANALSIVSRADGSTRTLELPARKPCGLFVSDERVYVTARGSHELLVFEVSSKAPQ